MFAFKPAPEVGSAVREETLRMWRAATARELTSAESLEARKSFAMRASSVERQANQRTVRTVERRKVKTQKANMSWKLRSLSAFDVREALDEEFRRTSGNKSAHVDRQIAHMRTRREDLDRILLRENELRGRLMHSKSVYSYFFVIVLLFFRYLELIFSVIR